MHSMQNVVTHHIEITQTTQPGSHPNSAAMYHNFFCQSAKMLNSIFIVNWPNNSEVIYINVNFNGHLAVLKHRLMDLVQPASEVVVLGFEPNYRIKI